MFSTCIISLSKDVFPEREKIVFGINDAAISQIYINPCSLEVSSNSYHGVQEKAENTIDISRADS